MFFYKKLNIYLYIIIYNNITYFWILYKMADTIITTITLGSTIFNIRNASFYSDKTNALIFKSKLSENTPSFQPRVRKSPSGRKSSSGRNSPEPKIKLPSTSRKVHQPLPQEQFIAQEQPPQHFVWQPPQNVNFITQDGIILSWMPNNTWSFLNGYGHWECLTEHTGIIYTVPEGFLVLQKPSGECVYMYQQ